MSRFASLSQVVCRHLHLGVRELLAAAVLPLGGAPGGFLFWGHVPRCQLTEQSLSILTCEPAPFLVHLRSGRMRASRQGSSCIPARLLPAAAVTGPATG